MIESLIGLIEGQMAMLRHLQQTVPAAAGLGSMLTALEMQLASVKAEVAAMVQPRVVPSEAAPDEPVAEPMPETEPAPPPIEPPPAPEVAPELQPDDGVAEGPQPDHADDGAADQNQGEAAPAA